MKQSIWITSGVIVLVLVLGGAAMVGGRLLDNRNIANDQQEILADSEGEISTTGRFLDIEPADELPDQPVDVAGLLVRREDNRLFLGTGNLSGILVDGDPRDSSARWEYQHDGPVVEVVATHATLIYLDDTNHQFKDDLPTGPIQQILIRRTLEEIEDNSTVSAWGERRGDRLIATVIVFYRNG